MGGCYGLIVSPVAFLRSLAVLSVVLIACSGESTPPPTNPLDDRGGATLAEQAQSAFFAAYPRYTDEENGIRTVLGTPDLGVGTQRVGFVLSDELGLVRLPVVRVTSYFLPGGEAGERVGPAQEMMARFFEFPYGVRGIYSAEFTFDRPGDWQLEVRLPQPDGGMVTTAFAFPVAEQTRAPSVGDDAPRSESRTADDVESLAELTTGSQPDAALYRTSIVQALDAGRPFVVVFASPAFCTNALCGPQVEVLSGLAAIYGDRADFIHVDLYENPHEIKGDLDRAVRTPLLLEWGLETDEWTFLVDAQGRVAARFEAFATRAELEAAVVAMLDGGD